MSKVKVLLEGVSRVYYREYVEMEESDWHTLDLALDEGDEEIAESIAAEYLNLECPSNQDPLEDIGAVLA